MSGIREELKEVMTEVFDVERGIAVDTDNPLYLLKLSNTGPGYVLLEAIDSGWQPSKSYVQGKRLIEVVITDEIRKKNLDASIAVSIDGDVYRVEDSDTPGIFALEPVYQIYCRKSGEMWNP